MDMEQNEIGKYAGAFGLSFAITSILSALLVILKETNEHTVLAWMKAAGHHWVTHGVLDLIVFLVLGWLFSRPNNGQGIKITPKVLIIYIAGSIAISALIIYGFYI